MFYFYKLPLALLCLLLETDREVLDDLRGHLLFDLACYFSTDLFIYLGPELRQYQRLVCRGGLQTYRISLAM